MGVTESELTTLLRADEPDFTELSKLGPEALPILHKLVEGGDPELATKAAGLAGKIPGPERRDVLGVAMQHDLNTVRMAAARAATNLPSEEAHPLIADALRDSDAGVRAVAARSVGGDAAPELRGELEAVAESESDPAVRDLMRRIARPAP